MKLPTSVSSFPLFRALKGKPKLVTNLVSAPYLEPFDGAEASGGAHGDVTGRG
jgi:hypothetical protein